MNKKNVIPVVFCFNDNYMLGAYITIFSMLENANKSTKYEIYIIYSELSKENMEKLNAFKDIYNIKINYINVGNDFNNAHTIHYISKETYYRLLIPWLIKDIDKILYLDCDLIIDGDLQDLYNLDIQDSLIAGSIATSFILTVEKVYPNFFDNLGVNKLQYINAGILIINSKKFREMNLLDLLLNESKKEYHFSDQDILNIVCKNKKYIFNPKYNNCCYSLNFFDNKYSDFIDINDFKDYYFDPIIFHYVGEHKPWDYYYPNSEAHNLWWKYYKKSPIFSKTYFDNKVKEFLLQRRIIENNKEGEIDLKLEIENLRLNCNWFNIFGISNNNEYLRITLFGIKFTFKINKDIVNKLAWWIPIRKLRDNFRNKFFDNFIGGGVNKGRIFVDIIEKIKNVKRHCNINCSVAFLFGLISFNESGDI